MNAEERLMDALLREQAKGRDADRELLAEIERRLEGVGKPSRSAWRRVAPLSIAAGLALSVGAVMWTRRDFAPELAVNELPSATPPPTVLSSEESAETKAPMEELADSPASDAEGPDVRLSKVKDLKREEEAPLARAYESAAAGKKSEAMADQAVMPAAPAASAPDPAAELSLQAGEAQVGRARSGTAFGRAEARGPIGAGADLGGQAMRAPSVMPVPLLQPEPGRPIQPAPVDRENYGRLVDQPWKSSWEEPLSTFSVDVDTASYTNLRRMIRSGGRIQKDAVRIEEMINYFDYRYPQAEGEHPFGAGVTLGTCPWNEEHLLARVAIKAEEIERDERPASNLVFLIDVSGSMQSPDKLELLKQSMRVLVGELDERDRVGIVVYAGTEGVVLPPTRIDEEGRSKALAALAKLEAGGSTNGGAGLKRAYEMALENKADGGVNRVILATDGDFNVGTTGQGELVGLVKERAAKGVSLSVLGFGTGNLNDAMLEAVTNEGDGNYFYIDGEREARRVFLEKLTGTLVTVAKDVKVQVEFNPGKVTGYRLIGYANRVLRDQDFNNDKVDAGDIGAGHAVTAFYEIVPQGVEMPAVGKVDRLRYQKPEGRGELVPSEDWLTLKLRYKQPGEKDSSLIEVPVKGEPVAWDEAGLDFRFGSAVALAGMKLREVDEVEDVPWERVVEIGKPALAEDPTEQRAEFLELVKELE